MIFHIAGGKSFCESLSRLNRSSTDASTLDASHWRIAPGGNSVSAGGVPAVTAAVIFASSSALGTTTSSTVQFGRTKLLSASEYASYRAAPGPEAENISSRERQPVVGAAPPPEGEACPSPHAANPMPPVTLAASPTRCR